MAAMEEKQTGDAMSLSSYWNLSAEEVALRAGTEVAVGLSAAEAQGRLARHGRNVFGEKQHTDSLRILLEQLKSPLILVLAGAAAVTIAIAHYQDAAFIMFAIAVNAVLGFWQEYKAGRALDELGSYLRQRARVIREGREHEIDAEEIVPGDVLRLSQGDRVAADARVVFANDLQIDESVLTGESLPVSKSADPSPADAALGDRAAALFAGTLTTQGVGTAIVVATGASTEIGKIAALIAESEREQTPLQKTITTFSIWLSVVLALLTLLVFVIGIAYGKPFVEMFLTSVAIAVSAIPEGLPISMTVILAVGVERMARRKAVVRRLIAAEALGSATVVLTDKTGTLTQAAMTLDALMPREIGEDELMRLALSNSSVLIENPQDPPAEWRMSGKIMEVALVRAAALRGVPLSRIEDRSATVQSVPFNSAHKYSLSLRTEGAAHRVIVVGAPDVLLARAQLPEGERRMLTQMIDTHAAAGERLIAVATKEVRAGDDFSLAHDFKVEDLSFDGIITFRDPLRPGIADALARVRRAGVRVVILTGDHKGTALAVAREAGIEVHDAAMLDAAELASLDDDMLRKRLPELSVVSRVTPADKLRIAKLFQESGEIVAMTGDGVNDAPSIKQANVGIAMGSGTEVARDVADLVLLNDDFETIVAAIEEGRRIVNNIRKVIIYLLSNAADELILIGGSIVAGVALPLGALQILWVNFFSDSFPALAFAFEQDRGLSYRPAGKGLTLFDPLVKVLLLVIGLATSALLFALYLLLLRAGSDEDTVRTFIFAAFGTYSLLVAFSLRRLDESIFAYNPFANRFLTAGVGAGLLCMIAAVYLPPLQSLFDTVPLSLPWIFGVLAVGVVNILLIEAVKAVFARTRPVA